MKTLMRPKRTRILLEATPLLAIAAGLLLAFPPRIPPASEPQRVALEPLRVSSAEALADAFAAENYPWPPSESVPALEIPNLPDDLSALAADERKALFLRSLLPIVLAENAEVRLQREFLQATFSQGRLDPTGAPAKQVVAIAREYRLSGDINDRRFRQRLLERVDEVPAALALAQAAVESGWGTSRFARQANNLFGHFAFHAGSPIAATSAAPTGSHGARVFQDVRTSVRAYVRNLNTHHAYARLRQIRAESRTRHEPLQALRLADGLLYYSERGQAYVDDIKAMIRANRLMELSELRLAKR